MKKSFTAKLWKVMRFSAVQGMIAIILCGVGFARTNYAQVLDREVTVSITDLPFEDALRALEHTAGVKFAYSMDQLEDEPNVSLVIEKRTLRYTLEALFTPRKIQYKVHEKDAVITLQKIVPAGEGNQSRLNGASNDTRTRREPVEITGTVTEAATGTPMAGVNILVKGTASGTTTDTDGRYKLAVESGDVLVFSFIGFSSIETPVNGRTVIDVVMTQDALNLGEVVVNAGYWEVKDRERTGNISRVTSEEIAKQPVNNPLQALQGRMPGVYIQQNTGVPGGGLSIQIRGQNSLRTGVGETINGNLPLYIIDGIPFTSSSLMSSFTSNNNLRGGNPLSAINPNDIESIEVLKDADATAIYGSRGANGVVLITTKKAKAGRAAVDADFYCGVGQIAHSIDLLNTNQYVDMRMEALKNDGYIPLLDDPQFDAYWPDLKSWDTTRHTNWQEKLIGGTAKVTSAQISFATGNANTQVLFAGGYHKESTVFPGDNLFHRGSGRFNINHISNDGNFNAAVSLNYTSSASSIPSTDFTSQAITLPPNAPDVYDADGKLNWENGTWSNPLAFLQRKYNSNVDNLVGNASLTYKVFSGLKLKGSVGYTTMNVNESSINPLSAYNPDDLAGRTGSSSFADAVIKTWIVEPQADYALKVVGGNLNVTIGTAFQYSVQSGKTIEGTGYTNDALLENINAATDVNIISTNYSQYRYSAGFIRLNYNWKEKYIVNLTARRDGSSRFGKGNQFANFGAIGAAWIFSNERFVTASMPFLSFGKVRASYGTTGSDAIGNYQYLDTYSPTTYPYNGAGGLVVTRLSNPNYSWEQNKKAEVAMDLGFMRDRIFLSGAFYLNRSSNQLVGLPLPVMTGQSGVQFNFPATVENRGWELQATLVNIKKNRFEWATNFNITMPKNELTEFPGLETFPGYMNKYDVGKSLFTQKVMQYAGVDPQTGVYVFEDVDGDGTISSSLDLIGLEEVAQQWYGGVNNRLTFGSIQLDFFFQFVKQSGYSYMRSFTFPGDFSNQPAIVMNRWRQEGDVTDIQRFTVFDPNGTVSSAFSYSLFSDNAITDASFVRLKNVSLSWQLPTAWTQKVKIKRSKIYVQGQNLATFTNYIGLDPENMTSQSLPPLRMIIAGFRITL